MYEMQGPCLIFGRWGSPVARLACGYSTSYWYQAPA